MHPFLESKTIEDRQVFNGLLESKYPIVLSVITQVYMPF